MKLQKIKFIMLSLAFAGTSAIAAPYYRDITNVGTSAEMIGIGNIQGFSKHALVLLESPAGLSQAGNSLSGFYTSYFGDSQYMTGAMSYQLSKKLTLGLAAAYESSNDINYTATNNMNQFVSTDPFTVDHLQTSVGLAYSLRPNLHVGISSIYYKSNIFDVHGSGNDLTVGALYQTEYGDLILNGKNILGNKVRFSDQTSKRLAEQWSLGAKSKQINLLNTGFFHTELFGQIKQIQGVNEIAKSFGFRVYPFKNEVLSLSLGYNEKPIVSTLKRSITAGIHLNLDNVWVAYSYDTSDVYQNNQQHYFSVGFRY